VADRPTIVAHRGLHAEYPENSNGAFRAAHKAGIEWIELDVHASADGEPVIIHDETLDRTTEATGPVAQRTLEQLQQIHLRRCNDAQPHWCRIPALGGWIGSTIGLLVEVKPPDSMKLVRKVIDILTPRRGPWVIQSFDERNLIHALACDVGTPTAMLVEDLPTLETSLANGWKNIHVRHDLLDAAVAQRMRLAGIQIGVWTPNTERELWRVLELDVDMIITDEPLLARQLIAERK
jgi:glycerophosphoryl diester phosphodiesterase